MSTNTSPAPAAPSDAQHAVSYVEEQLAAVQRTLKITRIVTISLIVIIAGYAVGITSWMHHNVLEPTAAAEVATARAMDIIQESGTALSEQVVQEVPAALAQLPDMLLDQMPQYRMQLEDKFEQTLADYGREFEPEVEAFLNEFLEQNHDQVHAILSAVNDPKLTKRFGDELEQEILAYLKTPNESGESVLEMLDYGRVALEDVEARLHRLAYGKNLTAEELKLRRIVAATLKTADINL